MKPHYDFKIVLLYDDLIAGLRGSSVLERLAGQLKMESDQLDTGIWKFEALLQPEFCGLAISEIMQANMIIISADGFAGLPDHIIAWLERALSLRQEREAAIVALVDWDQTTSGDLPHLGRYLRELAAKTGMDFFCNEDKLPLRITRENHPVISEIESDFATLTEVVPRESGGRGWGIND